MPTGRPKRDAPALLRHELVGLPHRFPEGGDGDIVAVEGLDLVRARGGEVDLGGKHIELRSRAGIVAGVREADGLGGLFDDALRRFCEFGGLLPLRMRATHFDVGIAATTLECVRSRSSTPSAAAPGRKVATAIQ